MRRSLFVFAALAALSSCDKAEAPSAALSNDHLRCDITYEMLFGSFSYESNAVIDIDLERDGVEASWTVAHVRIAKPWEGSGEMDPWAIFVEGRSRPILSAEGAVLTLFEAGRDEHGFTVNLENGDVNWTQGATGGDAEYYGECRPRAAS
jgi:hypothetical protein